mmetsp:Transcript_7068/g.5320  ORF Transcript_7068/g.5320 Transcript_7068/m.5320 type:complete len:147 (-) Transcript_7068:61-501(-)
MKKLIGYEFDSTDLDFTTWKHPIILALLGFGSGILTGGFGQGGLIMTSVSYLIGMHPLVVISTMPLISICYNFDVSVLSVFEGQFSLDYTFLCGACCIVGTTFGKLVVGKYIERKKKYSYVIFALELCLLFSITMLALKVVNTLKV